MDGKRASGLGVAFGSLLCLGLASNLLNPAQPEEPRIVSVPLSFHMVDARGQVNDKSFQEYKRQFAEAARTAPNGDVNEQTVQRLAGLMVRARTGYVCLRELGDSLRLAKAPRDLCMVMDSATLGAVRNRPRYTPGYGRDVSVDPSWKPTFLTDLKDFINNYPESDSWRGFLPDVRRMESDPRKRLEVLKTLEASVEPEEAKGAIRGQMWMARQWVEPGAMVVGAEPGKFDLGEHRGRHTVVVLIPPHAPKYNTDFSELEPLSKLVVNRKCDYVEVSDRMSVPVGVGHALIPESETLEEFGVADGGMVMVFDPNGLLIQVGRVSKWVSGWLNGDLDRLGVPKLGS